MPTRMPKTFKGYPAGVNPKSVRVVRRGGQRATFMQQIGLSSKNIIKTRVLQGGVWHLLSGTLILIMTVVADSQYGFSRRFNEGYVGLSLLQSATVKAILEMIAALYTLAIWYLALIMNPCNFHFLSFILVCEAIMSVWSIIAGITALVVSDGGGSAFSTGERTLVIFLVLVLCASGVMSVGFTVGIIREWKENEYRHRHSAADFSSVVVAKHRVTDGDTKTPDSSDDDTDSSDDDVPRRPGGPSAPVRAVALPTPGPASGGGTQPVFYRPTASAPPPVPGSNTASVKPQPSKASAPPVPTKAAPSQPVHDETTRAQFAHLWQSMQEVGNFNCGVSRVPGVEELVAHLRKHNFLPLMTGDNGAERKLYFYSEEVVDGERTMVFLSEFKFDVQAKSLDATFKSHDKAHIQQVRKFNLQELFQVVRR